MDRSLPVLRVTGAIAMPEIIETPHPEHEWTTRYHCSCCKAELFESRCDKPKAHHIEECLTYLAERVAALEAKQKR